MTHSGSDRRRDQVPGRAHAEPARGQTYVDTERKTQATEADLWKCGDAGAGDSAPLSMDGSLLSAPLSYGSIGDSPPGEGRTRNLSPPPSVAGLAKSALTVVGDSAGG